VRHVAFPPAGNRRAERMRIEEPQPRDAFQKNALTRRGQRVEARVGQAVEMFRQVEELVEQRARVRVVESYTGVMSGSRL
jgi:hypothetical protein